MPPIPAKKFATKAIQTTRIVDKGITTRVLSSEKNCREFLGISTALFHQIYYGIEDKFLPSRSLSKKDQLVLFIFKLKSSLTLSAISVIFDVHERTISRVFSYLVDIIYDYCQECVVWLSKAQIKATMPPSFKLHAPHTRVIIGKINK